MDLITSNAGVKNILFFVHFILFFCTSQTDKKGCATFTFKMSNFTRIDSKVMQDQLVLKTKMEEEGTGKS